MGQAPFVHKGKEQESHIGKIRVNLGMSVDDLQEKSGVVRTTLSALSSGALGPVYEKNCRKILPEQMQEPPWVNRIPMLAWGLGVPEAEIRNKGFSRKKGHWRWQALLIAYALETRPEELFPRYFCSPFHEAILDTQTVACSMSTAMASSPEDVVHWRQKLQKIHNALDKLRPRYKEVFVQYYIIGKTIREIAGQYNVSPARIDVMTKRSLKDFISSWNVVEKEKAFLCPDYQPEHINADMFLM